MSGPTYVIGVAGSGAAHDAALLAHLEHPGVEVVTDALAFKGTGSCTVSGPPGAPGARWSSHPLRGDRTSPAACDGSDGHGAVVATAPSGAVGLRADASAAAPLYVELHPDRVRFASRLRPLALAGGSPLHPDWDAWAHILTTGGPLGGRTPFRGISRLCPGQRVEVLARQAPRLVEDGWSWLQVGDPATGSVSEVLEALEAEVSGLAELSGLGSMLSGGWDSRVLATLAASVSQETRAWTTSSDTGTSLEELVAAKVSQRLGLPHTIVPAPHDRFGSDLVRYGRLVDHQSSFHVWAVPLADALRGQRATVLDGLGGGIFLDDAFAEGDGTAPSRDQRFARLARYLDGAAGVLRQEAIPQLRERTRTAYDTIVSPLDGHPHGRAFTAYLTRTFPGISHGPLSLIGDATAVAVPFLNDAVVRAALALPAIERSGGALYRSLLRILCPDLAELPTASELTGPRRQLPRRGASELAARVYRDLLTREPVSILIDPDLLQADLATWERCLSRTRQQHLIRGLAILSLWLEEYADHLGSVDIDELLAPVG